MAAGIPGSSAARSRGEHERSHMAQLCRGFLMLSESDSSRARSFLVAFLREQSKSFDDD